MSAVVAVERSVVVVGSDAAQTFPHACLQAARLSTEAIEQVVIDLSGVQTLTSKDLKTLLVASRMIKRRGKEIGLVNASGCITRLLQTIYFDRDVRIL